MKDEKRVVPWIKRGMVPQSQLFSDRSRLGRSRRKGQGLIAVNKKARRDLSNNDEVLAETKNP